MHNPLQICSPALEHLIRFRACATAPSHRLAGLACRGARRNATAIAQGVCRMCSSPMAIRVQVDFQWGLGISIHVSIFLEAEQPSYLQALTNRRELRPLTTAWQQKSVVRWLKGKQGSGNVWSQLLFIKTSSLLKLSLGVCRIVAKCTGDSASSFCSSFGARHHIFAKISGGTCSHT